MSKMDTSFDENDTVDVASVTAEFPLGDDFPHQSIPVKKLSSVFDNLVKSSHADDHSNNNMKVFLRVRPFKGKEPGTITIESDNSITTSAPESSKRAQYTKTESRHYVFTRVFGGVSTQEEVYEHTTLPLLQRFLGGDNCVMFAYGMTNAGKTYTIQGSNSNPGVLPRLVTAILDEITSKGSNNDPNSNDNWDLHISMLEIYQESIFDLLSKKKEKLSIRDANGKVEVSKLSTHSVKSTKEACKLMDQAASRRSKSSTFLNTGSSRSHAVYTVTLDRCSSQDGVFNQSVAFQLVDLAGAERGNRTKATGAQQKEANNINMSLMQLWRCLQGMKKKNCNNNNNNGSELCSSQEIIPFRESKLTHLLMPILNRAGMSGISMIACVNPQEADYDETLSILGNASIASKIKEISDVGRTAAQLHSDKSAPAPAVVVASLNASGTSIASLNALKKRRIESAASIATTGNAGGRESIVTKKHPNTTTITVSAAVAKPVENISGAKRTSSLLSTETIEYDENGDEMVVSLSECKRLRQEIQALKELNAQLSFDQYMRETEIRAEVSEEMAMRSGHLLEQIQSLQSQLNNQTSMSVAMSSVTASVKKQRKHQLRSIAEENATKDLQEVEDELERTKLTHEQELALLKTQNDQLLKAVKNMEAKVGAAPSVTEPSSLTTNPVDNNSAILIQNIDSSSAQVAAEFSNRLQRDQRFKKNDENAFFIYPADNAKKSPVQAKSPSRSPLSNVGNSPVQIRLMKGYQPQQQQPLASSEQQSLSVVEKVNQINLKSSQTGNSSSSNSMQSEHTGRALRSNVVRG